MTRVLTALLLIPLATGLIFFAPPLAVRAALTIVALFCLRECLDIVQKMGAEPFRPTAYAAGAVLILTSIPMGGFLVAVLALLMALTLHRSRHETALIAVACTLFALAYTCGPFALARRLHDMNPHWLFVVLLVNWVGDSAALYVGKAIGRHKLAPSISPGKTWEGAIASVVFGAAAGTLYLVHFQVGVGHPAFLAGFSLTANVAGQLGDLAESVLKRGAHIKDSGEMLPGHGGMLDRMDGALFALPAAYLYLIASTWIPSL
jgi:phosphatidate cytidylyltransferase